MGQRFILICIMIVACNSRFKLGINRGENDFCICCVCHNVIKYIHFTKMGGLGSLSVCTKPGECVVIYVCYLSMVTVIFLLDLKTILRLFFHFYYFYTRLLQHFGHKVLDIFILINYPSWDSYANQAVGSGCLIRSDDQSYLLLSN